ncbi:hypothetical protein OQA88_2076 [Cercophora sp. LCS_1]
MRVPAPTPTPMKPMINPSDVPLPQDLPRRIKPKRSSSIVSDRETHELRSQLNDETTRADQAERAFQILQQRIDDSRGDSIGNHHVNGNELEALRAENRDLKAKLDDARSHIFSLQPYIKELTAEEVGADYDAIINNISDWAFSLVQPTLDDAKRMDAVLSNGKKDPAAVREFRQAVSQHADLMSASKLPDTDVDIIMALTSRYVHDCILQQPLLGEFRSELRIIEALVDSMNTNKAQARDLYMTRTWRAEALTAILNSTRYQAMRADRAYTLARDLMLKLRVLTAGSSEMMGHSVKSCMDQIITPTILLHEKVLTSIHHFYHRFSLLRAENTREQFLMELPSLKCENVLQNRKAFVLAELDSQPAQEQRSKDLHLVMTVAPAYFIRKIGKSNELKEPTLVRKQHVLVRWGSDDEWDIFVASGQRTLVDRLNTLAQPEAASVWNIVRYGAAAGGNGDSADYGKRERDDAGKKKHRYGPTSMSWIDL